MPLNETGKPAPHHYFEEPGEARKAVRAGIEFLIDVDGYSPSAMSQFTEDEIAGYEDD